MGRLFHNELNESHLNNRLTIKYLNNQPYEPVWKAMKNYAQTDKQQADELWVVQHNPVYTRGIRCKEFPDQKAKHIPLITVDRGGLMTYHGPGQIILYGLMDIRRKCMNIKQVVSAYEQSVINLLEHYDVEGCRIDGAPGVYVQGKKIASIGIRVKNNKTYHGLSVNFDMDLRPFKWINTCGFENLEVTQLKSLITDFCWLTASNQLITEFINLFDYAHAQKISHPEAFA